MTEEEKKAIEDLKKFMNKYEAFVFYSKQKGDTAEVNPHIRMYESYKNVLNLIEKQDKMIEYMAGRIVELLEEKNITNHSKKDVIDIFKNLVVNNLLKENK